MASTVTVVLLSTWTVSPRDDSSSVRNSWIRFIHVIAIAITVYIICCLLSVSRRSLVDFALLINYFECTQKVVDLFKYSFIPFGVANFQHFVLISLLRVILYNFVCTRYGV